VSARRYRGVELRIPARLNVAIALLAYACAAALLWLASHAQSWMTVALAAIAFSFVNNTVFSLLHESVHGLFHPSRVVNDMFGRVSAAFIPTGFSFQRLCHLGHHRRNRTDREMFDYYTPEGSRFIAWYRLYSLLMGFYWLSLPIGSLLVLLFGDLSRSRFFCTCLARPMGFEPMIRDLQGARVGRMRVEIAFTVLWQASLVIVLDLTWVGWLACYGAFALNWCALQYTDHAWTVRDIRNGASNLRVNRLVQTLFLNYHHHLAHHQHPNVPWVHLPGFVDFVQPRPSFLRTYLSLWCGPRLTTEPEPDRLEHELGAALDRQAHS